MRRGQAETTTAHLAGYAVRYDSPGDLGDFKEVIARGAFTLSLRDEANDVLLLDSHQMTRPVARRSNRTLTVSDDPRGVTFNATVDPSVSYARDLLTNIETRTIKNMSFGFIIESETWEERDGGLTRHVTRGSLVEISPVSRPVYQSTSVGVMPASQPRSMNPHVGSR